MDEATDNEALWRDEYALGADDETAIMERFLLENRPLSIDELSEIVAEIKADQGAAQRSDGDARLYDPADAFEVGERLTFPLLDGLTGEVVAIRDGENPRFPAFRVIQVALGEGQPTREFAAELEGLDRSGRLQSEAPRYTAEELLTLFGPTLRADLERLLEQSDNFVGIAARWLPTVMLASYGEGHLNIAEAMIDITGEPMQTGELLTEMPDEEGASESIRRFSLEYALDRDPRFENDGTPDAARWFLPRLR